MTKNYAELIQGINQGIPDNDQGLVSPADIRENMIDLADWANELPDIENVKGAYNASTNSPTLTAIPDPTFNDGAYYDVTVSGAVGFAGSNFTSGATLLSGDKLKKKGSQWYLIKSADFTKKSYLLDQNAPFTNSELEAIKVIKNIQIQYKDDSAKDDIWIINAFSKGDVSGTSFDNFLSLKNTSTNQEAQRMFTSGEISVGYAEFDLSSITGYSGCIARIWFDYNLTALNNTYLVSGSASSYQIKLMPISSNQNTRISALESFQTLATSLYTKKPYLLSQGESFTSGELEALKVLKHIEIGYNTEARKSDVWIVNALSKNRTTPDSTYINFISFKNTSTNQEVNRNFTSAEILIGYAEIDISSVTGYSGCIIRIWFDYSLTSLDNTFIISGTAPSYQIKILPRFTYQNISISTKNIFSVNQLVPRKYVNPTGGLYVFNYGTNFLGSGFIPVNPSSTLIIKGVSPSGNSKALQYCDANRNILGSTAGYTLGTSAFVNNQFSVPIPAGCYFVFFTIKLDTESTFDYSAIRIYNSTEIDRIEKISSNPIQATSIVDGAKTYSGKPILDSSLVPVKSTLKYAKSYFTDFSGLTATGFTPTVSDGAIKLTGGTNDFSQYFTINNLANSDEQIMVELIVRVNAVSATNYGIGIGKRSLNSWSGQARSILGQVAFTDTNGTISFSELTALANRGSKLSQLAILDGNILRIRFIQSGFNATIVVENISRGGVRYDSYIMPSLLSVNVGDLCVWNFGGSNDILGIRVVSGTPQNNDILCIGDSKTKGDNLLRWSRFINPLGSICVMAGNSDRTVEVIQTLSYLRSIKPKYSIICLSRNDVASGIGNFTWQSNYVNIVGALTESGTKVIHLLPIPETSMSQANQDLIKNFIIDNFGSSNCIDVSSGWDNATMLSADNIHPNEKGDRYIASVILASGKIPLPEITRVDENWEDYLITKVAKV